MGLLDLLFKPGNSGLSIYSNKIDHYSVVYFPEKVCPSDNIDMSKIKGLYCRHIVFDGINVENNIANLRFSLFLDNEYENPWGIANVNMCLVPTFKDGKEYSLSTEDNISHKQLFLTDICRLTMTSIFYKYNDQYYFYARTTKGIYFCIYLKCSDYLLMEYIRSRFQNGIKVSSPSSAGIIKYGDITIVNQIKFDPNPEVIGYDLIVRNNNLLTLRILTSVDGSLCLCYCDLSKKSKPYEYTGLSLYNKHIDDYINDLISKNTKVFELRNQIDCGFVYDGKANIIESIVFLERVKNLTYDEKMKTSAIRFYKPAYTKLIEFLKEYIKNIKVV